MKKLIFIALGLLYIGSVSAQNYPPPRRYPQRQRVVYAKRAHEDFYKPKFGIVAGANFSNIVNTSDGTFTGNGTKAGLNLGLSADLPIVFPFSFEPEVLYSEKGYTANTSYGKFTQRDNFIDVPLLAKFQLAPGFNFLIGPQISFLTSTQNVYQTGFTTTVEDQYNKDSDGYTKTLLDGVIGVSFDLTRNVELRGRYTLDLESNSPNGGNYVPQYRNQVFQVGLGFKF